MRGVAVAIGVVLLCAASGRGEARMIEVECRVDGQLSAVAADFQREFCAELRAGLTQQLGATFAARPPKGWTNGVRAVVVRVTVLTADRADVRIETGRAASGTLARDSVKDTKLASADRGLTPFAARTLIRDIGLRLGLV